MQIHCNKAIRYFVHKSTLTFYTVWHVLRYVIILHYCACVLQCVYKRVRETLEHQDLRTCMQVYRQSVVTEQSVVHGDSLLAKMYIITLHTHKCLGYSSDSPFPWFYKDAVHLYKNTHCDVYAHTHVCMRAHTHTLILTGLHISQVRSTHTV